MPSAAQTREGDPTAGLTGSFAMAVESDREWRERGPPPARQLTYGKALLDATLQEPGEPLALGLRLRLTPAIIPEGDFTFATEALFVERLHLSWQHDDWRALAGKFEPRFGGAGEAPTGLFGADFLDAYQLTERLGLGVETTIKTRDGGRHRLSFELFTVDSSPLSQAAPTRPAASDPRTIRPGRRRLGDGGVGNTGTLDSWLVSATGADALGVNGLSYSLHLGRQAPGVDGGGPEWRGLAGVIWQGTPAAGIELQAIFEWAGLERPARGERRDFVSGGAVVTVDGWVVSTIATVVPTRLPGRAGRTDGLISLGLDRKLAMIAGGELWAGIGGKAEWLDTGRHGTLGVGLSWSRPF